MIPTVLDCLYKTDDLKSLFGDRFVGPPKLEHHTRTLIAKYPEKDNDGYGVEIYCTPYPAAFFDIVALDSQNSVGDKKKGFTLSTGSGCAKEAKVIAEMLHTGMLGLSNAAVGRP